MGEHRRKADGRRVFSTEFKRTTVLAAFVGTFKRDYVNGAELRDAETVLAQLAGWFDDYNTQAPHSALGMRSPAHYRAEQLTLSSAR